MEEWDRRKEFLEKGSLLCYVVCIKIPCLK